MQALGYTQYGTLPFPCPLPIGPPPNSQLTYSALQWPKVATSATRSCAPWHSSTRTPAAPPTPTSPTRTTPTPAPIQPSSCRRSRHPSPTPRKPATLTASGSRPKAPVRLLHYSLPPKHGVLPGCSCESQRVRPRGSSRPAKAKKFYRPAETDGSR